MALLDTLQSEYMYMQLLIIIKTTPGAEDTGHESMGTQEMRLGGSASMTASLLHISETQWKVY